MTDAPSLAGRRGLVVGIVNEHSLAHGCAQELRRHGAVLAVGVPDAGARRVEMLAGRLQALAAPLDPLTEGAAAAAVGRLVRRWGRLDFVLHAAAFCPEQDLARPLAACSAAGFAAAMRVGCHVLLELAAALPEGGRILAVRHHGLDAGVLSLVRAAQDAAARALRITTLDAGPLESHAAVGLPWLDARIEAALAEAEALVPVSRLGDICARMLQEDRKEALLF
jgi:enoyl-[acyl-carrier protein] reductase I